MSILKEEVFKKRGEALVVVLNVLSEGEFQKLHIEGSQNLPLTQDHEAFAQEVEKQFGKKKFFILYGSNISSRTAMDAGEILQKRGFDSEVYLSGIKDWNEAGYPTEGIYAIKKEISL